MEHKIITDLNIDGDSIIQTRHGDSIELSVKFVDGDNEHLANIVGDSSVDTEYFGDLTYGNKSYFTSLIKPETNFNSEYIREIWTDASYGNQWLHRHKGLINIYPSIPTNGFGKIGTSIMRPEGPDSGPIFRFDLEAPDDQTFKFTVLVFGHAHAYMVEKPRSTMNDTYISYDICYDAQFGKVNILIKEMWFDGTDWGEEVWLEVVDYQDVVEHPVLESFLRCLEIFKFNDNLSGNKLRLLTDNSVHSGFLHYNRGVINPEFKLVSSITTILDTKIANCEDPIQFDIIDDYRGYPGVQIFIKGDFWFFYYDAEAPLWTLDIANPYTVQIHPLHIDGSPGENVPCYVDVAIDPDVPYLRDRLSYEWTINDVDILSTSDSYTRYLDIDDDGEDLTCNVYTVTDGSVPNDSKSIPMAVSGCYSLLNVTESIVGYKDSTVTANCVYNVAPTCDDVEYMWYLPPAFPSSSYRGSNFSFVMQEQFDGLNLRVEVRKIINHNTIAIHEIPLSVDGCYILTDQTDSISGDKGDIVGAYADVDICPSGSAVAYDWYVAGLPYASLGNTAFIDFELKLDMDGKNLMCTTTPNVNVHPIPVSVSDCPKLNDQTDFITGTWSFPAHAFVDVTLCNNSEVHTFATDTFYNWYIEDDPTNILSQSEICDFTLTSWHNGRNLICQTAIDVHTQPIPIVVEDIPSTPDYWWIRKADGSYFKVKCNEYKQDITINYELLELSNRKYKSIDRGLRSDRYSTTLTFFGKESYIKELAVVLDTLREYKYPVIMGGIDDNIFGDHVNYGIEIITLVESFGELKSTELNTMELEVTFLASNLSFVGTPALPEGVKCLGESFTTATDRNTHINETYFRNNYFVDRSADRYFFKGEYILTDIENRDLFRWWQTVRGEEVTINEADFGVEDMFGTKFAGISSFNVVVRKIEYERMSPTLRSVSIELEKM